MWGLEEQKDQSISFRFSFSLLLLSFDVGADCVQCDHVILGGPEGLHYREFVPEFVSFSFSLHRLITFCINHIILPRWKLLDGLRNSLPRERHQLESPSLPKEDAEIVESIQAMAQAWLQKTFRRHVGLVSRGRGAGWTMLRVVFFAHRRSHLITGCGYLDAYKTICGTRSTFCLFPDVITTNYSLQDLLFDLCVLEGRKG